MFAFKTTEKVGTLLENETENIRAVAQMKMDGKRPRGRPR